MEIARRIEEVSLNAWPCLQQIFLDGWQLRFSGGYSKRANAIITHYESHEDIDEKIQICERQYVSWRQPAVYRITPFSPPTLDTRLAKRGYLHDDPTIVMFRELEGMDLPQRPLIGFHEQTIAAWLEDFYRLSEMENDGRDYHRKILSIIPVRLFLTSMQVGENVVASGMGVLEREYLGLFSLVTGASFRRKGFGTQLIHGILAWAEAYEASCVYLQVREGNEPAISLYSNLGFRELYNYWYRIQP